MIQKIKTALLVGMTLFALGAPVVAAPATSYAACSKIAEQVSSGANGAASGNTASDCGTSTGVDQSSISKIASGVVNVFSLIVGIVAVIMIIFGGFRYITSGGDSGKVGNAKNSLVYAIIGLIVVALAQVIVHFVLAQTGSLTT
jgi:Type IV secretion system pilin